MPPSNNLVLIFTVDGQEKQYSPTSERTLIGRAEECGLCFPFNREISRVHAALSVTSDGWVIEDLQSRSGTFVNGEQLAGPRRLADRERIAIGNVEILVREAKHQLETVDASTDGLSPQLQESLQAAREEAGRVSSEKTQPIVPASGPPEQSGDNWYQLLGLPDFCNDLDKIQVTAKSRLTALREATSTQHAREIEQVSQALACLLNAPAKREYDVRLANQQGIEYDLRGDEVVPKSQLTGTQFGFGLVAFCIAIGVLWYLSRFVVGLATQMLDRFSP